MMKKLLLMALMAILCLNANAQYETELRGRYFETVTTHGNDWDNPTSIYFKNDGTCTYNDNRGTLECVAYILSNGGKTLHLVSDTNFAGEEKLTIINLRCYGLGRMTHEVGNWLHLAYYGSTGTGSSDQYVEMEETEIPSSVGSVEFVPSDTTTMYNLDGTTTKHPRGVYIQGGKKRMPANAH